MIFPNPKKAATMILSKMSPSGMEKSQDVKSESELDPSSEGLKSAAEDMMQAFHDKSPHDLVSALSSFIDQYDTDDDME